MKRTAIPTVLVALTLSGGARDARAGDAVRIIMNGAFNTTSLEYGEARTFTEFLEPGTIDAQYKDEAGPGFDVGLQYNFFKHLGVLASVSLVSQDGSGSYSARLPHPLYFDRPRSVSGSFDGLKYNENAGHVDLVLTGATGPLEFNVFGGATFFRVETDLLETVQYSHSYPYDSVTVTAVPKKRFRQNPSGFNVGGRLDYRLGKSRRFGLGTQIRFSRATIELTPSEGNSVKFDVGGLQVGVGARLYF